MREMRQATRLTRTPVMLSIVTMIAGLLGLRHRRRREHRGAAGGGQERALPGLLLDRLRAGRLDRTRRRRAHDRERAHGPDLGVGRAHRAVRRAPSPGQAPRRALVLGLYLAALAPGRRSSVSVRRRHGDRSAARVRAARSVRGDRRGLRARRQLRRRDAGDGVAGHAPARGLGVDVHVLRARHGRLHARPRGLGARGQGACRCGSRTRMRAPT